MRILEFKHIAPFDGCFWRWEYLAVDSSIDFAEVYPIIFAEGHLTPQQVLTLCYAQPSLARDLMRLKSFEFRRYARLFKEFKWYDWGSEIFQGISHAYVPDFWKFAQQHGLYFVWKCDECGKSQFDEPVHMAGCRGNGSIGIEVEGWLCEDCERSKPIAEAGEMEW